MNRRQSDCVIVSQGLDHNIHGSASEKKEIDPNNRGSVVLGSVAYYMDRYGYECVAARAAAVDRRRAAVAYRDSAQVHHGRQCIPRISAIRHELTDGSTSRCSVDSPVELRLIFDQLKAADSSGFGAGETSAYGANCVTAARARRGRLTAPLRTLPTADGADNPSLIADLFYTEVLLPAADRHSIKW